MTIRHLKIFVAVCEHGSTTKAAEALYIVQPTVSLAISDLEKYYKVTLFERINQRLVLTEIGRELLVKAKEILAGFEDFESLATACGQHQTVRIGVSLTLGQTMIPRFLYYIQKNQLPIQPQILIRQTKQIENELESGNLEFAIVSGEIHSQYLKAIPLSDDRFVAVCNANYEIPDSLTLKELTAYPLLLREHGSSSRDFLEKVAEEKGLLLTPTIDSTNNQALVTALYFSLGVSFLPNSYVADHIARKKLKEITVTDLTATQTNYLVIHKNKKLNANQQQAFDLIRTV